MKTLQLNKGWILRDINRGIEVPAIVPGTVYTDLLREGQMEDPFFKDNEDKALALMEGDFSYHCTFPCDPALLREEHIVLRFEGLDTLTDVTLNGVSVGKTDNMHRVYEFDVKDVIGASNELTVTFHSPLRYIREAYEKAPTRGSEDAMPGFVHIRKAHCMFGWDWGAHLPDAGIFRPAFLCAWSQGRLETVAVRQEHGKDLVTLSVTPVLYGDDGVCRKEMIRPGKPAGPARTDLEAEIILTTPDGEEQYFSGNAGEATEIAVNAPKLWWPNGYGAQPLYTLKVLLKDRDSGQVLDEWERRIGLRTLTVSQEKDEWGNEFAVTVNGVKIFAMGADYIPEDHLLGRVSRETTKALLKKALFAHFNVIRVWGGGYYPDDWFFDLCDEYGLLVWQDFMFACGMYDLTPAFEENIRAEFYDNIIRLRHHASLALMCGNNEMELFTATRLWVTKDAEVRDYLIMYEYILPKLMEELAPQVFYWPASPSSGGSFDNPADPDRGDVHYWDVWHGNKPFTEYRKFYFRFVSEFGFQSFPSERTVETFTDDERDKNIFSYIFERHQRNGQANGKIMGYLQQTFRYPDSFSDLIYASQLLQAEAIRYGVEHFRRYRGRCMGSVIWQLNDCWPVSSWSSVDYCGRLKALHYYARRFFAPLMVSCEEESELSTETPLNVLPREIKQSVRFCVANETMGEETVTLFWEVRNAAGEILREEQENVTAPALSSVWTKKTELSQLDRFNEYVSYRICRGDEIVSAGTVLFTMPKYFRFEDPGLSVTVDGRKLTVRAQKYARSVEILNETEDLWLSDNYFDLNAGEKTVEILQGEPVNLRVRSVYNI
ncbi:MAG: glycoside hydrolase family 2 protein [Lachnospiraceae bacterium]|nr:glycoside hydrolase family 2 protein [Lachnospiraceae bacterium]